jgi:hypothetical protein
MNINNDEYCSVFCLEVVALVLCLRLRWSFRVINCRLWFKGNNDMCD